MAFQRRKLARDNLPLRFPKIPPEKAMDLYFTSKAFLRNLTTYGDRKDEARDTMALQMITSQRKVAETEEFLVAKRVEMKEKMKELAMEKKDLAKKEVSLRANFIKYHKFIKENSEKRVRLHQKITYERELQLKRTEDISFLTKNRERLLRIKTLMENRIKKYRFYEDFLLAVVSQENMSYKNVNDVLYRYHDLLSTKESLAERHASYSKAVEQGRIDLAKLVESKMLTLVGLTNDLTQMTGRYEEARRKALEWESTVQRILSFCARSRASYHQLKDSIKDMYGMVCRRRLEPTMKTSREIEDQLRFIKDSMTELDLICRMIVTGNFYSARSMML